MQTGFIINQQINKFKVLIILHKLSLHKNKHCTIILVYCNSRDLNNFTKNNNIVVTILINLQQYHKHNMC